SELRLEVLASALFQDRPNRFVVREAAATPYLREADVDCRAEPAEQLVAATCYIGIATRHRPWCFKLVGDEIQDCDVLGDDALAGPKRRHARMRIDREIFGLV